MTGEYRKFYYWLLLSLVSLILCLPILLITYIPLVDYPNHLARSFIFHNYESVPAFQSTYLKLIEPIPDLGIELVLSCLLPFVSLLTASKIFLLFILLIFVTGCHRLGKAIHGHPTFLALPCCFFFYNWMLMYGMVNYVFGIGVFTIALSYWLEWRKSWTGLRFLFITVLVICAYLIHLTAYGFIGVTFAVITLWNYWSRKDSLYTAAIGLLSLIFPLVLFLFFMRGSGKIGGISWNTIRGKLLSSLALIVSYNYTFDLFSIVILFGIVVVLISQRRRINVVLPTFIAGAVLAFLYLICPMVLLTSMYADIRFVVPAALLIVLSLKLNLSLTMGKFLLFIWLLTASLRVGAIGMTWINLDKRIGAEVERLMILPEGAKVCPIFIHGDNFIGGKPDRGFEHLPLYTTINRHAVIPTLFSFGAVSIYFRSQPLYVYPSSKERERWLESLNNYDYIWSYGDGEELKQIFRSRYTLIYEADGFSLWRVNQ